MHQERFSRLSNLFAVSAIAIASILVIMPIPSSGQQPLGLPDVPPDFAKTVQPGCYLPGVVPLVTKTYGQYAMVMHGSVKIPPQPASDPIRFRPEGEVGCEFARSADMKGDLLLAVKSEWYNLGDASGAFSDTVRRQAAMTPNNKYTVSTQGSVQVAVRTGQVVALLGQSTVSVRWFYPSGDPYQVAGSTLAPIAMALLCPNSATQC
jgi:hypothetical protein